jgi:polyhydroxyalkanoate synthesis regulator phasin
MFSTAEMAMERFWELSLVALGSMARNQEQAESLFKKYLEQSKQSRDEGTRFVEEVMTQAKQNQQQFRKMIAESVISAFDQLNIPAFNFFPGQGNKAD